MAALVPCFHPVPAYQAGAGAPVRLHPPLGTANLSLPCGNCIGCRKRRAVQWAIRCLHEASQWKLNTFLTLTYSDECLPKNGHLDPVALQLFLKRLRRLAEYDSRILRESHGGIRFFAAGEYGERSGRPHYHLLLFNCDFADRVRCGEHIYSSKVVAELWPFGGNVIGTVTPKSAQYVAQYSVKKQGGVDCDADGVVRPRPFVRMSLRPGIGATWLAKYASDLQHGYTVSDARPMSVPRGYLRRLEDTRYVDKDGFVRGHAGNPQLLEAIEQKMYEYARRGAGSEDRTAARLLDAEKIAFAVSALRERSL